MTNLQEVPTEELLSFHDYPVVHQNSNPAHNLEQAQINVTINNDNFDDFQKANVGPDDPLERSVTDSQTKLASIWSIEFYQRFFDVDTKDVTDRIMASMTPKTNNSLRHQITEKPDLYGPFWISTTLIFTIAISGNISDYLHHKNDDYNWRYDFQLVSYAATAIWCYVLLVPLSLWGVLLWSTEKQVFNEEESGKFPGPLTLICIYGYSLFIYIPVSILWCIQIGSLQWFLAIISSFLSGSVLLLTLMSSLRASKHKVFLIITIITCHFLLAAGFMLYFFHTPDNYNIIEHTTIGNISRNTSIISKDASIIGKNVSIIGKNASIISKNASIISKNASTT